MTKLDADRRNALPNSEFALPVQRKYPIDTNERAANAKARAQQQYNKGHISLTMLHDIDAKADSVLKK